MAVEVCLVLGQSTLRQNLEVYERWRPWVDRVELRADRLEPAEWKDLGRWPLLGRVPCILTLRRPEDGGSFVGPESERLTFFSARSEEGWDWWDVEENHPLPRELEARFRAAGGKILRSFHDFQGIPPNAWERAQALGQEADAVKLAVQIRSSKDLIALFSLARRLGPAPRVVVGMGEPGLPSRILGAALGSLWTYATSEPGPNPLGQLDPETLQELYRVGRWEADQPVFGVVGKPISHSRSPTFHNRGLDALHAPGIYVPFLADDLADVLALGEFLDLRGLSVTLPHKEAAATVAAERIEPVGFIGAANTLVRSEGRWCAHNTDAAGFLHPLKRFWGSETLNAKRITVIGSGGAARAVVWALRTAGVRVLVLGRTLARATELAKALGAQAAPLSPAALPAIREHSDAIVQTTSAGMGDQIDVDPLDFYPWTGRELAYDVIYSPRMTRFLRRAQEAGCPVLTGWDMFLEQARQQFRLFTGRDYPDDIQGGLA